MKATLFDRYGGFGAVHRVVLSFYDRMLDSDIVGPYFDDVDMPALVDHQTKFISQVMGGPATYTNEVLEQLHRNLDITQEAFNEMADILESTLFDFDFAPEDVRTIMSDVRGRRQYIVSRS
ncbi:MAG TPA: group 1 truncated hemoglobin [Kiloniellaceae bacterium]|nr:group 1 truncated hemoglobin [Kiloniellaceae bacterium]